MKKRTCPKNGRAQAKLPGQSCHKRPMRETPYIPSERRRCNKLLKQNPSSLLMLLGWSSISMVRSMCPELVESILVSWCWMQWPKQILCSAMADLPGCSTWMCCGAWNVRLMQMWPHSHGILSALVSSSLSHPWTATGSQRYSLAGGVDSVLY
jgi:hypothetical protein